MLAGDSLMKTHQSSGFIMAWGQSCRERRRKTFCICCTSPRRCSDEEICSVNKECSNCVACTFYGVRKELPCTHSLMSMSVQPPCYRNDTWKTQVILPKVQISMHPFNQRSLSWPTVLSRHSMGTYQGNELTRNPSENACPQSSQLAEPPWIDPGLKGGVLPADNKSAGTILTQPREVESEQAVSQSFDTRYLRLARS